MLLMITLKEALAEAEGKKVAIGHFNAPVIEMVTAVINAALKLDVPVILGFSESERDFFRTRQAVAYVRSVREETQHPIFINADHTYDFGRAKEAVNVGFDSVIYDAAEASFEENTQKTKELVDYAHKNNPEVLIEAEFGFIGKGSSIKDDFPEGGAITEEHMTDPEKARQFVEQTGIDLLAPAVGNLHGIFKKAKNPNLNIERIRAIREQAGVPLVLHGGSGVSDEDFKKAIAAGISTVHISTEMRIAYRKAIDDAVAADPEQIKPYHLMKPVREAVQAVVEEKLILFNNL